MRRKKDQEETKSYVPLFSTIVCSLLILVMAGLCSCGGGGGGAAAGSGTAAAKVLTSITIQPADNLLAIGKTQQFTVLGTYSDGTTADQSSSVSWKSSAASVATITANGLVTAVAAGQTTITATVGTMSNSTTLTVPATTLVSLAIAPSSPTIAVNTTQQFTATGAYSDGSFQTLTSTVTWNSSDTSKVTIDTGGKATAVASGTATITATLGSKSATASLTVTSATLSTLALTPLNPSVAAGTPLQFSATGTFSNSTTQNLTTLVTWSSSDTSKVTINSAGKATAVAVGSATITAAFGGLTASTTLTVTPATLSSITVTPASPSITAGTTQQFSATGTFSDGTNQDLSASATWSSSTPAIASIAQNGLATAVAVGTTTISATYGGKTGSQTLSVTPVVISGTWEGTYTIYDSINKDEIGTYTYKFILNQSGVNVTGTSALRYNMSGQVQADGVFLEGTVTGRQFNFVFSYIDSRTSHKMVNIGSATIGASLMTGSVLENYNAGYNCSYIFSINKQ